MSGIFLRRLLAAILITVVAAAPAQARRKPFGVVVTDQTAATAQQPSTASSGFTTVQAAVDYLDPVALSALFPNAATDIIGAAVDFRGLPVGLDFKNSSDAALTFAAINQTYIFGPGGLLPAGQTSSPCSSSPTAGGPDCAQARKASLAALRDFLKSNPAFLKAFQTALAQQTPIDPIAGNPDSLFSRRSRADFTYGFTNKVSQIWGCGTSAFNFTNDAPIQVALNGSASDIFREAQARAAELQAENEIGIGVLASSTAAKGSNPTSNPSNNGDYNTLAFEVPLSYTVKLDSDPRKKIHFELPLGYTDNDGSASYSAGFGLAYTHPLTDNWSLTPAAGVGATASPDLGSGGGVDSFSLTSAYTWRLGGMALSMGNAAGRYSSLKLKIGDVQAETDIKNTVFTNGLMLTGPNSLIAGNWVIEYSLVDTRITGDKVYTDNYDEIGIAAGHITTQMGVITRYTKFGLSYLLARGDFDRISSLRLTLTSRF